MENCRLQKLRTKLYIALAFIFLPGWCFSQKKFYVPDAAIVQHAGSIGYFSIGAGWELFGNKRGNVDVLYGYVPQSKGGKLDIVTAKFAYRPFVIKVKDLAVIYPANPGAFFSYTIDEKFSFSWDKEQYGISYYGWSEAFRSHVSLSNEIELKGKKLFGDEKIKAVVLYSEFNANDLYLVSWAINREAISFGEIFKLGVGLKIKF